MELVHICHRNVLLGELALALRRLHFLILTLEDRLAILVELQLCDHAL